MDVERVDPERAQELLQSDGDYVYLDVRSRVEFEAGHVPNSVNVPLLDLGPAGMAPNPTFLEDVAARFPKEQKIITGCQRGARSLRAAHILKANGFSNVVDMRGGYDGETDPTGAVTFPGWARRGLPTTT